VLIWKQLSETEKFLELGIYLKDLRRIIEHWSIEFAFQLCYLYIKIHTVDNIKIALTFLSSPTHTRFKKKIKKSKNQKMPAISAIKILMSKYISLSIYLNMNTNI
jgi:hypothetical protein